MSNNNNNPPPEPPDDIDIPEFPEDEDKKKEQAPSESSGGEGEEDEIMRMLRSVASGEESPRHGEETKHSQTVSEGDIATAMDVVDKVLTSVEKDNLEYIRRIVQMSELKHKPILLKALEDHTWLEHVERKVGKLAIITILAYMGGMLKRDVILKMIDDPDYAANIISALIIELVSLFREGKISDLVQIAKVIKAVNIGYQLIKVFSNAITERVNILINHLMLLQQKYNTLLQLADVETLSKAIDQFKSMGLPYGEVIEALRNKLVEKQ